MTKKNTPLFKMKTSNDKSKHKCHFEFAENPQTQIQHSTLLEASSSRIKLNRDTLKQVLHIGVWSCHIASRFISPFYIMYSECVCIVVCVFVCAREKFLCTKTVHKTRLQSNETHSYWQKEKNHSNALIYITESFVFAFACVCMYHSMDSHKLYV